MNPEEQLRAMAADAARWELEPWTPSHRPSTNPSEPEKAGRGRWWAIGFSTVAVVVVAAIVLFIAVGYRGAQQPHPIQSQDPTPSITPTPDPTPTKTPAPPTRADDEAPALLFGGSCDTFLPQSTVTSILGSGLSLSAPSPFSPDSAVAAAQLGGIDCLWSGTDFPQFMELAVVRADAMPAAKQETCGPAYTEGLGSEGCTIDLTVNGIRVSGGLHIGSGDDSKVAASALVSELRSILLSSTVPDAEEEPVGTWDQASACPALADVPVANVTGSTVAFNDEQPGVDSAVPPALATVITNHVSTVCMWQNADRSRYVGINAFAGSRWMESIVSDSAEAQPLEVARFDAAYVTAGSDGRTVYDFFRGPNWLRLSGSSAFSTDIYSYLAAYSADALDDAVAGASPGDLASVTQIVLDSDAMVLQNSGGDPVATVGYFTDSRVTAIDDLTRVFGVAPEVSTSSNLDYGDVTSYSWGGVVLRTYGPFARFAVDVTEAKVHGIAVRLVGGIAVGDSTSRTRSIAGDGYDASGLNLLKEGWEVHRVPLTVAQSWGPVRSDADLGDVWAHAFNDAHEGPITRIGAPTVENSP